MDPLGTRPMYMPRGWKCTIYLALTASDLVGGVTVSLWRDVWKEIVVGPNRAYEYLWPLLQLRRRCRRSDYIRDMSILYILHLCRDKFFDMHLPINILNGEQFTLKELINLFPRKSNMNNAFSKSSNNVQFIRLYSFSLETEVIYTLSLVGMK